MTTAHAEASADIDAPAEAIYALLIDYRDGHPSILPKQYFSDLVIESGGHGAGTVFRVRVNVFGTTASNHMLVSEPEPGRVLAETDTETGLVTTFTLTPIDDGRQTEVRIATDWTVGPGLRGKLESLTTPPVMRHIYDAELRLLAERMQSAPPALDASAALTDTGEPAGNE
jgi:hypothetical protein